MSDHELKPIKHEMPFGPVIEIPEWVPPEQVVGIMATFDADLDGEISAQEAKANDAHESLFQVLTKLGVSADDLALALGIEPKATREKRQKEDREERDRFRKEWEAGQKFDKDEREKIKPAVVVGPVASDAIGLIAKVSWLEPKAMKTQYTNNTAKFATFIVRISGNDRPDRVVAPGKTVTSSYTTTIKTGFTGQKLVVTHKESGVVVLEQTL
jgi:hypothetical protein